MVNRINIISDTGGNDDDWTSPDSSHGEELASLGLQEGVLATVSLVMREDPTVQVFFLTVLLIFSIFTLDIIVTLELLIQTDLESSPLSSSSSALQLLSTVSSFWLLVVLVTFGSTPFSGLLTAANLIFIIPAMKNSITLVLVLNADLHPFPLGVLSCSAHQHLPTASVLLLLDWWFDFTAAVDASFSINRTLARSVPCASVAGLAVASMLLPKGLVCTHLRVDCLPSGSFANKPVAGAGEGWIAPLRETEAASRAVETWIFIIISAICQDVIQVQQDRR